MLFRRKKTFSLRESLEQFCQNRPDQCRMNPGLSESDIGNLEAELGKRPPSEIVDVLRRTNGVDLFGGSLVLFGQHHGAPPYDVADLAKETSSLREQGFVSGDEIAFGQRASGAVFVAEMRDEPRVWIRDLEMDAREFASVGEWWSNEMQHWEEVLEGEED